MTKGIYIKKKYEYLEKFNQNTADLSLLGRGDGTEVMIQNIKKDSNSYISPGEKLELMEFFYILEGIIEIKINSKYKRLSKGDYIYVHELEDTVQFRTLEDTQLLYITSKPTFFGLSKSINELMKISKKSQKKDMYTHDHGSRVQKYSIRIANKLNLNSDKVENIAFASLFHDVGKIHIPDKILMKPDKLTVEEMNCVKEHPDSGYNMLQNTYYKEISKIVRQHHERLDGSGYPKGLKDEDIMIEAKIIGIADAFDAMTTNRPYRKALTENEAVEELRKDVESGKYDEKLFKILRDIIEKEND
jgi:HD-GYP domain-containing protein (c-di-GMP phosphodiesterase class II)